MAKICSQTHIKGTVVKVRGVFWQPDHLSFLIIILISLQAIPLFSSDLIVGESPPEATPVTLSRLFLLCLQVSLRRASGSEIDENRLAPSVGTKFH